MPQADFYHLQKQTLENVLPKLLEKAYATGKRIKVKIGNEERVEFINGILWTYDDQSFIPHGSKKDGFAEDQPVWLTAGDDNPNNAEFLFLVDLFETWHACLFRVQSYRFWCEKPCILCFISTTD